MSTGAQARAQSLYENGRYQDAETAVLELLSIDATQAENYVLLAKIEYSLGNANDERNALERAVALGDTEPMRLKRLGSLYTRKGEWDAATRIYQQAIQAAPDELTSYQGLARGLFAQQDLAGLDRLAAELQERFPEAAYTSLLGGHVSKAQGESETAQKCYAKALELDPTLGEALFGLVDLGLPPDDTLKEQAATLASRDDLSAPNTINASFAYARILDQRGEYGEAFKFFQHANKVACDELSDHGIVFEPMHIQRRIDHTINSYPENSFQTLLDPLPIDLVPIFVLGLARSGTTLVEQILASHSDLEAGGELIFARECEQSFRERRQATGRNGPIDAADHQDAELLEEARERYLDALFEHDLEGPWIVDKLPANYEIAGFLRLLFPNAPIIHTLRDPRATCFSLYTANFGAHEPYYHSLEHLAYYFHQYQRLMKHWRTVLPGPYVEIAYEDLVRNPETHIPALLRDIGLPPDSACLAFYEHDRPILTASHAQVRQPMYQRAIDHWRNYEQWLGALTDLQNENHHNTGPFV